jgi:hypothetical protein
VQGSSVSPGNIVFNNTTAYTLSGGTISGSGSLTKNGLGAVTIGNSLANINGIDINSGISFVYYHHIIVHLSWTLDCLISAAGLRPEGASKFPGLRQFGYAYFDNL